MLFLYLNPVLTGVIFLVFLGMVIAGNANAVILAGLVISAATTCYAGYTVHRVRREYSQLSHLAAYDGLTGLLNQKYFRQRLTEEIHRVRRFGYSSILLFADIDNFKQVNDEYGHVFGDFALKETARIIREIIRNIDVVSRYGGDEFGIILTHADIADGQIVAERICTRLAEHPFIREGRQIHLTFSIGMAKITDATKDPDEIIHAADRKMYSAKSAGGNQVHG